MTSTNDAKADLKVVEQLLLKNKVETEDWGELSRLDGRPCPKKVANEFLVCCLLDYQVPTQVAWQNGRRLVHEYLADPEDLWREITSLSIEDWNGLYGEYRLHRFPKAHERLWRIGKTLVELYDGDARLIWQGQTSTEVLMRFWNLGAGEQISRMIVGALRDCGLIDGASDLKADVHVCRVLGRLSSGREVDTLTAGTIARQISSDPWQLDWALWNIAKKVCRPTNPQCDKCYLAPHCVHAKNQA